MAENHLIFVDAEKSQENYAIPSAFAAYAKYMGIRLGNEKFLETDQKAWKYYNFRDKKEGAGAMHRLFI